MLFTTFLFASFLPMCTAGNYTVSRAAGTLSLWSTASFAYYKSSGTPLSFVAHFVAYSVPVSVGWKWLYLVQEIESGSAPCTNKTRRIFVQMESSCDKQKRAQLVHPVFFVTPFYAAASVLEELGESLVRIVVPTLIISLCYVLSLLIKL